jgi:hypothetical protein
MFKHWILNPAGTTYTAEARHSREIKRVAGAKTTQRCKVGKAEAKTAIDLRETRPIRFLTYARPFSRKSPPTTERDLGIERYQGKGLTCITTS